MPADPPTIDAPVLAGSAVRLRAVARADLPLLRAWRGDPATWALTMGFRGPIMEPGDDAWYAELARRSGHDRVAFAVDELETGSFVGLTQLVDIDSVSRTAVFGMQLGPTTARGRGLGAEALALTLGFARDALNLRKLTLQVVAYNTAARVLYERAGFDVEGTLREQYFLGGTHHDVIAMGLFL